MKSLVPIVAAVAALSVACRHTSFHTQQAKDVASHPLHDERPVPMLFTDFGVHTSADGHWRVEVHEHKELVVVRLGRGVSSSHRVIGWQAHTDWFAVIDTESRVWVFDGLQNLTLVTWTTTGPVSETLAFYGPRRFPVAPPQEVASLLPQDFAQMIIINE